MARDSLVNIALNFLSKRPDFARSRRLHVCHVRVRFAERVRVLNIFLDDLQNYVMHCTYRLLKELFLYYAIDMAVILSLTQCGGGGAFIEVLHLQSLPAN